MYLFCIWIHFYNTCFIFSAFNKTWKMYNFMTPTQNSFGSQCKTRRHSCGKRWTEQYLHGKQNEESHHQTEETHSLGQGKSQDSIWEQLLLQRWVPVREKERSWVTYHQISVIKLALGHGQKTSAPNSVMLDRWVCSSWTR